ncbi:MAG TPA: branched-chain amino acid ABC transporter permease [Stellaceae bacterium]|nr:branched-chain amino acid ABC transporter permease [Stellaceae bacterium]
MTSVSETANGTRAKAARVAGLSMVLWRRLGLAAALVLAVAIPFVASGYHTFQFTQVLIYAIALLGLNLLTGYNGQISLGHGAFYAIGAYTTAILIVKLGVPYWATVPVAGLICLVTGFLFGLPALRLEGLYLALATFALALSTPQILKFKKLEAWTGGVQGINIDKPDAPFGLPLDGDQWLYLFALVCLIPLFWMGRNLIRGRVGRAIVAIRDHPTAAETMGVNIAFYKSLTFGVSAAFTGVAGALGGLVTGFVAPDSFQILLSLYLLVGIVVGGLASIAGVFFGALFIEFVPIYADQLTDLFGDRAKALPWAMFGVMLIASMYLMPTGVIGLIKSLGARIARSAGRD